MITACLVVPIYVCIDIKLWLFYHIAYKNVHMNMNLYSTVYNVQRAAYNRMIAVYLASSISRVLVLSIQCMWYIQCVFNFHKTF